MSAKRAILQNVDILPEIFACLTTPLDKGSGMFVPSNSVHLQTLANAARCCKTFSSPALDALWWKLDDIVPLFLLLPAIHRLGRSYVLNGIVEAHDWQRFDEYAKRTRHLVYIDDENFHPSVFFRIAQLRNNRPLLPSLVSLEMAPSFEANILSFISPSLRQCTICSQTSHDLYPVVWTGLDALASIAPNLNFLSVQTTLSKASLLSISRMSNLRTLLLYCKGINDFSIIRALSSFQYLVHLEIFFDETTSLEARFDSSTGPILTMPFQSLENIRTDIPPKHLNALLMCLQPDKLKVLEVGALSSSLEHGGDPVHWEKSFKTIRSRFSNSLQRLKLSYHTTPQDTADRTPSRLFKMFHPLLELRALENATFLDFPWTEFSDEEFCELGAAWNGIKELHFVRSAMVRPPNATFRTLHTFAKHCPNLRVLSIPLNTLPLPPLEEVDASSSSLQILRLGKVSNIENMVAAGRYIKRVFPSLTELFI
ncbi:hypothetical protein BDZ94DRAFT_280828 [Collybia nuda]|uniref:F-box domain-containing protein n=1 Tax=Collybia nuda TaxID=64659 RepID=A0A9P5YC56_9AGAR|nr:hypothetical protein BDZ94DRAFT_280828 [Collybia nuda]